MSPGSLAVTVPSSETRAIWSSLVAKRVSGVTSSEVPSLQTAVTFSRTLSPAVLNVISAGETTSDSSTAGSSAPSAPPAIHFSKTRYSQESRFIRSPPSWSSSRFRALCRA